MLLHSSKGIFTCHIFKRPLDVVFSNLSLGRQTLFHPIRKLIDCLFVAVVLQVVGWLLVRNKLPLDVLLEVESGFLLGSQPLLEFTLHHIIIQNLVNWFKS